jgi:hypothetical protein
MQQFGRYRMNSGHRADTVDRSKMTQLGRRVPLPRTNFGRYDLVVGGEG